MYENKIIDGKKIAGAMLAELSSEVKSCISATGRAPCLAVIIVGEHTPSKLYVAKKRSMCAKIGITSQLYTLTEHDEEQKLLTLIESLNNDDAVDGILVQLPLPEHISTAKVINSISPTKDVDGFHPYNLGLLAQGRATLPCCTPRGIMKLLFDKNITLRGLNAVIVGSSNIVGKPMAFELLNNGCTVTICNSSTKNLAEKIKTADLLIVAIGKAQYIKAAWIKEDSIVIDVGINRINQDKIVGDIEFEDALNKVKYITPVPGGVGPMTVVTLLENTIKAYRQKTINKHNGT